MNNLARQLDLHYDSRILWLGLAFFVASGIINTYLQLTNAGISFTTQPPTVSSVKTNKPATPTTAPTQSAAAATAPTLPPFNRFPANSLELGRKINAAWFGEAHWPALFKLWTKESNWNPNARNRSSGACGIPQALPCSKINDHTPEGQIEWGLSYIERRYGNPTKAWNHWQAYGWY